MTSVADKILNPQQNAAAESGDAFVTKFTSGQHCTLIAKMDSALNVCGSSTQKPL